METLFRWKGFPTMPGLIVVGTPNRQSPVLVTCNFDLTVRRLVKVLEKGKVDCYVLVAPTKGINVWCAACGHEFTAHSVIAALKLSNVASLVDHRQLVLPQLAAPGVDPAVVLKETGWRARFGPIEAKDIPAYVRGEGEKSEAMRTVRFPVSRRVEMASIYAFMLSVVFGVFGVFIVPHRLLAGLATIWLMSLGAYCILPSLPGKSGYVKLAGFSLLSLAAILGLAFYATGSVLGWPVVLVVAIMVSIALGIDFNGMTPTFPSDLGRVLYKRGRESLPGMMGGHKFQPYGRIHLNTECCTGCGVCIQVCPRNVYEMDSLTQKVGVVRPEDCVNCNACVNRCPVHCLEIMK
jgi:NAD-dependent dihydropyrimidine dehydrogenase PreA subunit